MGRRRPCAGARTGAVRPRSPCMRSCRCSESIALLSSVYELANDAPEEAVGVLSRRHDGDARCVLAEQQGLDPPLRAL